MARPELLPKNAQNRFHEQGGWNMGTQVEESEKRSSSGSALPKPDSLQEDSRTCRRTPRS
eukprot:11082770-Prorocentrum_lima.AAC.1